MSMEVWVKLSQCPTSVLWSVYIKGVNKHTQTSHSGCIHWKWLQTTTIHGNYTWTFPWAAVTAYTATAAMMPTAYSFNCNRGCIPQRCTYNGWATTMLTRHSSTTNAMQLLAMTHESALLAKLHYMWTALMACNAIALLQLETMLPIIACILSQQCHHQI